MAAPFNTRRRVEFCETDAAGIAHFSVFFTYMEQAEHELLRHLGLSVVLEDEEGVISWPRVSAHCEYEGPVKFEDVLEIAVCIENLGTRSVAYTTEFTHDGKEIAAGRITAACCRIEHDKPPRSIVIPDWIAQRMQMFIQDGPVGE